MKKVFAIALSLVLTLSIAGLAVAAGDKIITHKISAELETGYLQLPGYKGFDVYDNGGFLAQLSSLELRLNTDLDLSDEFSVHMISQFEIFKDESDSKTYTTVASPILNYGLTYNPGPVKVIFDAKGRDAMMGIKGEELLKLNVARRYATNSVNPDGDPKIYRYYDNVQAKQLTVEVPLKTGRIVSVFSLEPTPQGNAGAFVGGFGEANIGAGKFGLGYQAQMSNDNPKYQDKEEWLYKNPVPAGYFVVSADYQFNDRIRLQCDYSTRDDGGDGYQPWFRPISVLESYDQTPFLVKTHFNSKLSIDNYELGLRILNIDKYWLDASYAFASRPYMVGINYRNWAFSKENAQARADDYVAEIYGKRNLKSDWQDYLKVFYRTDNSFGACVVVVFD
jgi:hypothetical protein